jgi:hypothetical protein
MRRNREFSLDLFIETDPAGYPSQDPEPAIIKAFASTEPVALQIKCYSRHENQVQTVCGADLTFRGGFADPELAGLNLVSGITHRESGVLAGVEVELGERGGLSLG